MGGTNRQPTIEREAMALYEQTTKAEWCELYVDLYRQTHGESTPASEWMADVERRLAILRDNRGGRRSTVQHPMKAHDIAVHDAQVLASQGRAVLVGHGAPTQSQMTGALALASTPLAPVSMTFACRPETVEAPKRAPAPVPTPIRPPGGFQPSPYQAAIFDFIQQGEGDGIVNAVAGSGKTTTLVQGAKLIRQPALFMAFNKHIADELQGRLAGTPMIAKTIHSVGNACVSKHLGRTRIDGNKYRALCERALDDACKREGLRLEGEDGRKALDAVRQLSNLARLNLIDAGDVDALAQLADRHAMTLPAGAEHIVMDAVALAIADGITVARDNPEHVIDFTDMLYLPYVWKLQPPQMAWVFVDECQDLSAAQLDLVLKCRAPGGRMLFVGDPRQAIYGFAGADSESYRNIQRRTGATELPLSICYRCPADVVALARDIVPEIEARPDAPAGVVEHMLERDLAPMLQRGDLILCRLTAPLVKQCLDLIAKHQPARVKGRDIGKQLGDMVGEVQRMPEYAWERFGDALGDYEATKAHKLAQRKNAENQIEALHDRCEAVRICYDAYEARSADELKQQIEELFTDEGAAITLSTVHRAKGLENGRVFILKPEKLPLTWPKQLPWQAEQETNLQYVAYTRAMRELHFVDA